MRLKEQINIYYTNEYILDVFQKYILNIYYQKVEKEKQIRLKGQINNFLHSYH